MEIVNIKEIEFYNPEILSRIILFSLRRSSAWYYDKYDNLCGERKSFMEAKKWIDFNWNKVVWIRIEIESERNYDNNRVYFRIWDWTHILEAHRTLGIKIHSSKLGFSRFSYKDFPWWEEEVVKEFIKQYNSNPKFTFKQKIRFHIIKYISWFKSSNNPYKIVRYISKKIWLKYF